MNEAILKFDSDHWANKCFYSKPTIRHCKRKENLLTFEATSLCRHFTVSYSRWLNRKKERINADKRIASRNMWRNEIKGKKRKCQWTHMYAFQRIFHSLKLRRIFIMMPIIELKNEKYICSRWNVKMSLFLCELQKERYFDLSTNVTF